MRLELLPFIEQSIKKHQEFLENFDQIEELQQREKARQEQSLIEKGEAKGEKAAKIEVARKMLLRGRPTNEIIEDTGLTLDEIKAIE